MARDPTRPALAGLVPYEPGKPVEEVQRELGLERVVKLASNEGQFGPFPAAIEALRRGHPELNRYPDGGGWRLVQRLAEKHGVEPSSIALAAGADAVIAYLCLATLDPDDEVVFGWPSFASYPLAAMKMGAKAVRVPLTDHAYDVERILAAITERTRIVYLCNPNNPTGTMISRAAVDGYFGRVPEHVLTVLDEAYHEYVDEPDYTEGIEEHVKSGRDVLVLRTFSKIYGLAGLRVGYGVGPKEAVDSIKKVRNAFDITQAAQDAAVASLDDTEELARRRAFNAEARAHLVGLCSGLDLILAPRPVANFVYAEVGEDSRPVCEALMREGVIVRPLAPFGAPGAIRVTVGTQEENELFAQALRRVLTPA